MRAAAHIPHAFLHRTPPAAADRHADQTLEVGFCSLAGRVGRGRHRDFDALDHHVFANSEAHPHLVHMTARLAHTAKGLGVLIGLDVDDAGFDVVMPVGALESVTHDGAGMERRSLDRC